MRDKKPLTHSSNKMKEFEKFEKQEDPDSQEDEEEINGQPQDTNDDNKLYCFCRKKAGKGRMIQCDQCKEWYHLRCLRMIAKTADETASYTCRTCKDSSKVKNGPEENGDIGALLKGLDAARRVVVKGLKGVLSSVKLAVEVESAMHKSLNSTEYKAKYRSLLFNLKENESLKRALEAGNLTPEKLLTLSKEELANEKIRKKVERVRQAEERNIAIIEDINNNVLMKKTHRGEELIEPETDVTPDAEYPVSKAMPKRNSDQQQQQNNTPEGKDISDQETIPFWRGKIACPGIPIFDGQAFFLDTDRSMSRDMLHQLMPFNVLIAGRLDIKAAHSYIKKLSIDPSRFINLLILSPVSGDDFRGFEALKNSLVEANRYGVGAADPKDIKDIYIATLDEVNRLSFLEKSTSLEAPVFPDHSLVLIIVPIRKMNQ